MIGLLEIWSLYEYFSHEFENPWTSQQIDKKIVCLTPDLELAAHDYLETVDSYFDCILFKIQNSNT